MYNAKSLSTATMIVALVGVFPLLSALVEVEKVLRKTRCSLGGARGGWRPGSGVHTQDALRMKRSTMELDSRSFCGKSCSMNDREDVIFAGGELLCLFREERRAD